jgi:type III secretion protein L
MTWLAIHTDPQLAIASDALLVPAAQVPAFEDAVALAGELARLRDGEAQRIAQCLRDAHAQGLREGAAHARREAHAVAADRLAQTLGELELRAREQHAALRDAVLELGLLVLRRIAAQLGREEMLAALVVQVLDRLDAEERQRHGLAPGTACVLRLHPELLDAVRRRVGERANELAIEWRADPGLDPLGCVIDTPAGRLLAGLDAQLEHVRAALRDARSLPLDAPEAALER